MRARVQLQVHVAREVRFGAPVAYDMRERPGRLVGRSGNPAPGRCNPSPGHQKSTASPVRGGYQAPSIHLAGVEGGEGGRGECARGALGSLTWSRILLVGPRGLPFGRREDAALWSAMRSALLVRCSTGFHESSVGACPSHRTM